MGRPLSLSGRGLARVVVTIFAFSGCVEERADETGPSPSPGPIDGGPNPSGSGNASSRPAPSGPFGVASSAFGHMEAIPTRHTCDAENLSPPLSLTNAPVAATTLALIMEDPDAPFGTVLHWTFWNLPWNVSDLAEDADLGSYGAREGETYRGPCPPAGEHRYFFYAYAVDGDLNLSQGASVDELRAALDGRVAAEAEMYGTYFRPQLPPL